MGSGSLAAYVGCDVEFLSNTLWFKPVGDWNTIQDLSFNLENRWWVLTKQMTEMAAESGKGKFFVGITDIGGIYDTIAMLRGPKNFVIDLFKRADQVKKLSEQLLAAWFICYEETHKIIGNWMEGTSAWMDIWSPKRWYPIQDDVAHYMSPKMFKEFVLPSLRQLCERLDYTIYHLDGIRQIPHLDMLLEIPELSGFQWVLGSGKSSCFINVERRGCFKPEVFTLLPIIPGCCSKALRL
jgi:5-methyltetrahydrofolate--homocysteine methyltransferase